jgi:hypothetical protein
VRALPNRPAGRSGAVPVTGPRLTSGLRDAANALRHLADRIAATTRAFQTLAPAAAPPRRRHRFGKLTPERAGELLPPGTRVHRHQQPAAAGVVAARADGGVYGADVSGWCTGVHVRWDDGREFSVPPRHLAPAGDAGEDRGTQR